MTSDPAHPTAFLFPGQGAHDPGMLAAFAEGAFYEVHVELLNAIVGENVPERLKSEGLDYLRRNEIASTVTVFCNAAAHARLVEAGTAPDMVAGYSVGQWSAMHAAGMCSLDQCLRTVWERARIMNQSLGQSASGMMAVIGLADGAVEDVCRAVSTENDPVDISNYNCLGQVTLAGTLPALAKARKRLEALNPRKIQTLEVSGAWHCRLLTGAVPTFAAYLETLSFGVPTVPVADNVTGAQLPTGGAGLKTSLAKHLDHPVRWADGVKTLAGLGAKRFVEVGFGDVLTKFGYFIERRAAHLRFDEALEAR